MGVDSDARLRLALLAVAEPPGAIVESRFRGPPTFRLGVLVGDLIGDRIARGIFVGDLGTTGTPLVPTPPSPGTTIFFAGESTAFSPSSTENGRFRFARPVDLGVEGGANFAVNSGGGLGLPVLSEGRAGDSASARMGVLLRTGSLDCALRADTEPGVIVAEAPAGVTGLSGTRKAEVDA